MPEPLTTLYRCPVHLKRWRMAPGRCPVEYGPAAHCEAFLVEEPVFSERNMQAVQEERDKLENVVTGAQLLMDSLGIEATGDIEDRIDALAGRAAVVAEALRALRDATIEIGFPDEAVDAALALTADALEGVDRSHELVPLGTQEALVDLIAARDRGHLVLNERSDREEDDVVEAALARARALVEGVEPARSRSIDRDTVRAVIAAAAKAKPCTFLKGFAADPQWRINDPLGPGDLDERLVSQVCERLEGVERTHTPSGTDRDETTWREGYEAAAMQVRVTRLAGCRTGDQRELLERLEATLARFRDDLEVRDREKRKAGSSDGHTLVPNEALERAHAYADTYVHWSRDMPWKTEHRARAQAWAAAFLEAARPGGRPQWPGTGDGQ